MTIRTCIAVAITCTIAAAAQPACPPTPSTYRSLQFGDARLAIEENCPRTMTQDEQLSIAGIAQKLLSDCKLPRDHNERALVERFIKASQLAISYTGSDVPLQEALRAQSSGVKAFAAGMSMMEDIRCRSPEAALLSRGVVLYLKQTSASSRFVAGCVEFYSGRYDAKACQCIAETLRAALPDVDQRYFDRTIISETINHAPFIALPLMFSCGLWNY